MPPLPFMDDLPGRLQMDFAGQLGWVPQQITMGKQRILQEGLLHKVPFFGGLDPNSVIQICATMRMQRFYVDTNKERKVSDVLPHGKPMKKSFITREGETTCEMYVIESGMVAVEQGGQKIGVLGQHHFFGELSALLPPRPGSWGRPAARTVFCLENVDCATLTYEDHFRLRSERKQIDDEVQPYITAAIQRELECDEVAVRCAEQPEFHVDMAAAHQRCLDGGPQISVGKKVEGLHQRVEKLEGTMVGMEMRMVAKMEQMQATLLKAIRKNHA